MQKHGGKHEQKHGQKEMGQHWSVVGVRSHMVIVGSIAVVCGSRRKWISWLWLGHSFNFDNCACPSLLSLSMDFPTFPPTRSCTCLHTHPTSFFANKSNPYNVVLFFFHSRCQWILCLWLSHYVNHKCPLLSPLPICKSTYIHNLVSFLR